LSSRYLDHVFDFPADDPAHDFEDSNMEPEEDPKEEPEEDPEEVSPPGSTFEVEGPSSVSAPPPHLLGHKVKRLKEDTESLYGSVRTLELGMRTRQTKSVVTRTGVDKVQRRMDAFDVDLGFIERDPTMTSDDVLALQEGRARDQEKMRKLERRVDTLEVGNTLTIMDRDTIEREFFSMRVWLSEFMGWGTMEVRPSESIDVLAVYGDVKHSEPHGPPDGPYTKEIGPTQKMLEELVEMEELVKMEELEKEELQDRWFKKMESVFEISKCAEDDKNNLKGRMTVEYCPRIEIQKIEHELWTLSMKGDDIDGYTNHFHELAMICPTLVTHEYKKIKRYVWGLPERIQGNVTSSRPTNIHEAVTMCHTP
ncbi:hypothetical protein Tco_0359756, partial [Tanacetum coccineum]